MPPQFEGLNLEGIADVLAVGCHAVRGDYTLTRDPAEFALRPFGLENHQDFPFRVRLNLPMEFKFDGENYWTTIRTKVGELTTHLHHTAEMRRSGISMPFIKRYPVRSVADLEAVDQVFEHLEVIPAPDDYARFRDRIGERGLAIASGPLGASPMHLLLHDLMPMEQFYYFYTDEREALCRLTEKMTPFRVGA